MKRIYTAIAAFILAITANAQQPVAIKNSLPPVADANAYIITGTNAARMDEEDNAPRNGNAQPLSFGRLFTTAFTPQNSGEWQAVPGGNLWRLRVRLDGARGVKFVGKVQHLPQGATIAIYNADGSRIANTYTAGNFDKQRILSSETVAGSEAVFEYFEPEGGAGQGNFTIERIAYLYRYNDPEAPKTDDFGQAAPCEVNVNCPEGDGWGAQKKAVVRIEILTGFQIRWCTGTLMNTTEQNYKPYILTAMHCGLEDDSLLVHDTLFDYWKFYFNYESPTCGNPASEGNLADQFITGAQVKAFSDDKGGDLGSDFLLLELSQNVPVDFHAYYSGWDLDTTNWLDSGVSIHHPWGDIKKISTYGWPLTAKNPYPESPGKTHWEVLWLQTPNGHGVTEGGSSGSPIFNTKGYLVGTLTGGNSSCGNTSALDIYGRLDWHWTKNGTTAGRRLKDWLDSANTGRTYMSGAYQYPQSVNEVTTNNPLKIYPNPVADWLHYSNDADESDRAVITVTNVLGKQLINIHTENDGWLDASALPPGIYFLSVKENSTVYTERFIKQ